ncbi:MAG: LysR family transcriptional regulator [Pseudohongiellaceae bacterium]|nr:LysR family transcriptional regulator [Pseudohongiellaceae bacterium]
MDTQNLKAFVAVAEEQSFSAAAQRIHITQPAISKRIHLLEEKLGVKLFDRIGRQVSLTEAGRTLLPHAREVLSGIKQAEQAIADLSGKVRGELKLITSHHIGLHRLPKILRKYTEAYPDVELNIRFMDSSQAYDSVLRGDCDLCIITEVNEKDDALASTTIWTDRMLFAAAPQHPLSQQATLSLKDISEFQALLPERHIYTTQLIESLFIANGLNIKINLSTNYLETIKALISVGYAWGMLPESMLKDHSLSILNVVDSDSGQPVTLERNLDCIVHRHRAMSNAGNAFFQLLKQHADSKQ